MDCFCNDIEFRYERAFPDIDRPYYTVQEELDEFQFGDSDFLMDICVLAYNHLDDKTALCVQKILQYTKDIKFHLILVDNGSTDGTLEYFRNLDYSFKTIVHFSENTLPTYPESNIHHYCKGKYVVRMGNDVIVTPNWYQSLLGAMERDPRCGVTIRVYEIAKNYHTIMVILDSCHTESHVLGELQAYSPLVSNGCYLVVYDTSVEYMSDDLNSDRPWSVGNNPSTAVKKFLESDHSFEVDHEIESYLMITNAPNGWLRKKG